MGRAPCCDKANVKRGPWSPEEDAMLKDYIDKYGTGGNWIALPQKAGLRRCGKSCRLRWLNYLRPNIKHGEFSTDEDRIICTLFADIGSRWSIIAAQLPGRTDNDIKNYWNTKLKKKILMGSSPSLLIFSNYAYANSSQYHKTRPPNYQPHINTTYSSPSISFLQSPSSLAFKFPSNTSSTYNYSTLVNSSTPLSRSSTFTAGPNCETMPYTTSVFSSSSSSSSPNQLILNNLQTQDASFAGPAQSLSSLVMFGGAATVGSGSCSTNSSDGSSKLDQVDDTQYQDHQQFMLFSNGGSENINIADENHKQIFNGGFNGATAQSPLDPYSTNRVLEEIKHLISSSNHHDASSYISNANLNFFVDDNKATEEEEKVMYY